MKKLVLSDIELFYSKKMNLAVKKISLHDEEFNHCCRVMRNAAGNIIYITDGKGTIYKTEIEKVEKDYLVGKILEIHSYENDFKNIYFCIPKLKNPARMKFALEKCVELGITNFILFESERTIGKLKNIERYNKILLSAMKQSLHSYLPSALISSLNLILAEDRSKILLNQSSKNQFEFINNPDEEYYFLFGPEGGFDAKEVEIISDNFKFKLSEHRLRTETAIIKCASLISKNF